METIGKRISQLREKHNHTKNDFTSQFNITEKVLYNIEHDITRPTIDLLIEVSEYYKVTIDYLAKGK